MEQLFTPQVGLMVWTILAFLVLVGVLAKFAWKPILQGLDAREDGIKNNIKSAEDAKAAAALLKLEYEQKVAQIEARSREIFAQAQAEAKKVQDEMIRSTKEETEKLTERTRLQLQEEQKRLVRDLRKDLGGLAVQAAEKILRKSLDKATQATLVQDATGDFDQWAGKFN